MRHHIFTAALGIVLAAVLAPVSATSAQAGDPTGYWRKAEQGQFPAKMQLYYCGGRSICVKIVWLQNPKDSKGRALQDVRNVNPALRGRTIEGMPIIKGMKQVSANQWKGTVYNPEDGKTYSATVTLASSRQIVLKGCVASFLCREQVWLRTSAPPPREEEKPEEPQVEASAKPAEEPAKAAPVAAAAAPAPVAPPAAAMPTGGAPAAPATVRSNVANAEVLAPATQQNAQQGYRYLNDSKTGQQPAGYTGESVSSMFSMATPLAAGATQAANRPSSAPVPNTTPAPAPAPAARTAPTQAAVRPEPAPEPASQQAATEPEQAPAAEAEAEPAQQSAEADPFEEEGRLTWRERRQLRRQRRLKELQQQGQNLIPWMRQ